MKEFPLKLRILRTAHNLTQAGLAYELERISDIQVSQSTICRLESGQSIPDAEILFHLTRIFHCDIGQLLTFHPEQPQDGNMGLLGTVFLSGVKKTI